MEAGVSATEERKVAGQGGTQSFREEAEHVARDAADAVREGAADLVDTVKSHAREMFDEQKNALAEQVHGVAEALRRAAEELENRKNRSFAEAVDRTAGSVDDVAETIRNESVGDLYHHAENFTRRHPGVVFGGAAAAAFLMARFLRASADEAASRARSGSSS